MYFLTGGRGTQSGLYRVTYVGNESTAPTETKSLSQNRRGLAHFAESSEQNVPVPLSAATDCVAGTALRDRKLPVFKSSPAAENLPKNTEQMYSIWPLAVLGFCTAQSERLFAIHESANSQLGRQL